MPSPHGHHGHPQKLGVSPNRWGKTSCTLNCPPSNPHLPPQLGLWCRKPLFPKTGQWERPGGLGHAARNWDTLGGTGIHWRGHWDTAGGFRACWGHPRHMESVGTQGGQAQGGSRDTPGSQAHTGRHRDTLMGRRHTGRDWDPLKTLIREQNCRRSPQILVPGWGLPFPRQRQLGGLWWGAPCPHPLRFGGLGGFWQPPSLPPSASSLPFSPFPVT